MLRFILFAWVLTHRFFAFLVFGWHDHGLRLRLLLKHAQSASIHVQLPSGVFQVVYAHI